MKGSEGKCSKVKHWERLKAGCNGKDIYGWESGENRRTGVKTCVQYGGKKY